MLMLLPGAPALSFQTNYTSFTPGTVWLASDSIHIDCHAGNILYDSLTKTYYWYGEHYAAPAGVECYSSKDLYNWVNQGLVLAKGTIQVCERPKVVYSPKAGKYVMWFHYDNSSYTLAELGVATADSATGKFTLLNNFRPNGHQSRDIGMFQDDSGKVYIMYAADSTNVTIRVVQLSADYTSVTANDTNISAHCEGPAMMKMNRVYYLMTSQCSGWTPNPATYYTALSTSGPFTNKGTPCIKDTAKNTFNSQSCNIFKIPGYSNAYMYMGDRWNGSGNKNSQYVFLPITITAGDTMQIQWYSSWNLSVFQPAVAVLTPPGARLAGFPGASVSKAGKVAYYDIFGRKLHCTGPDLTAGGRSTLAAGVYIKVPEQGVPVPMVVRP